MTLTLAAGQAACAALDIPANIRTAADLLRRAADRGADLLVLPELFLSGYELPGIAADPGTYALRPEDPRLDPLAAACAETRTAVVAGAPTCGSGGLYISALVLGRDGRFAIQYDKEHPTPTERSHGFAPGSRGCTLTLDGWRLGLGICWDSSFPEHAQAAALDGCDAYLVGAMFDEDRAERFSARAADNASYAVLANHSGRSGPILGAGGSAVWNPDGSLQDSAGAAEPGLAIGHLERDELNKPRANGRREAAV